MRFMSLVFTAMCTPRLGSAFIARHIASWNVAGRALTTSAAAETSVDEATVQHNYKSIQAKVDTAVSLRDGSEQAQLVVVSKTKPVNLLQAAYDVGARRFGENYIQELCDKVGQLPVDIQWHFIGHLQSNKAKKLVKEVPNLAVVETVDSLKLAQKLNSACIDCYADARTLDVYLQINTSGEESKSGTAPARASELALSVVKECPRLRVAGLMTIGAPGDNGASFTTLVETRRAVASALGVADVQSLALSMGMSNDFEAAIGKGATSVRVGSKIFGARDYSNKNT